MLCRLVFRDGRCETIAPTVSTEENTTTVRLERERIPGDCVHIDFLFDTHQTLPCEGYMFAPRACHSPAHPLTPPESASVYRSIAEKTRALFGGFASEGGFDFAADVLDYVLYTSNNLYSVERELCDETILFWQLVYHGSILYNPSTETVNYCMKDERSHLKFLEYGGRPLGYFNSKYVDEGGYGNWMGEEDMLCGTDEQLADALDRFRDVYEEYAALSHLQYELMVRHEKKADGVYVTAYSDGTTVTVDYHALTFRVEKP